MVIAHSGPPRPRRRAAAGVARGASARLGGTWVWLNMKRSEGQTAGFGPCFPFTRVSFWVPIFDPRANVSRERTLTVAVCRVVALAAESR